MNRSAEMDEWLHKINDHCEDVGYQRVIINKLNLAECIIDSIEDAVRDDRANQHDNAVLALKRINKIVMDKSELKYVSASEYTEAISQIIKDTVGEL